MFKQFFARLIPIMALLAMVCTACAPALSSPTAAQPVSPTQGEPSTIEVESNATPTRPEKTLPDGAVPVETVAVTPILGEAPDKLMDAIIADLVEQHEVDPQAIDVIQAEAVVWKDGSLGCAQPGQVYTQAPVDGYHVILSAGSQTYDYRAADSGYFFLCESSLRR